MNKEDKTLFNIAAILYNAQSDNIKRDNILKKVIESILVIRQNKPHTCAELFVEIQKKLHMIVVEEEILDIISNKKNRNFALDYSLKEVRVCLKQERYDYILNMNERTIESYIKEFVQISGYSEETQTLIEEFIYTFYCKNVKELGNLIGETSKFQEYTEDFKPEECRIIQEFIEWENEGKDKMLTAVANYALEYLLVSGNNELQNKKNINNVFANKKLYVDTNILFYCIGINGTVFEEANRTFLAKCKECREQIFVSYYTDKELRDTISHFVNEINRLHSPLLRNSKINSFISNKDVYSYYLAWSGKQHSLTDAKYYKQFLLDKYEQLIEEFDIQVERAEPFREEILQANEMFCDYEQEIFSKSATNYDARNVFYIESKRMQDEINLQNANTIFISADKELQKWDAQRNRKTAPVVVAPNLWLLLLARLISRSDDDFKCFISYINLSSGEMVITNKEFFEVVKTINDIVEDVRQQESVINVMVEEEFAFLNNGEEKKTSDFIKEKTEEKVHSILENKIQRLENSVESLSQRVAETEEYNDRLEAAIEEKDKKIVEQKMVLIENEQINEKDRSRQYAEYDLLRSENEKLKRRWRNLKVAGYILLILFITVPIVYEFCSVFVAKNQNPISLQVFNYFVHESVFDTENKMDKYWDTVCGIASLIVISIDVFFISRICKLFSNHKDE